MSRLMSVALTEQSVRDRTKTMTRRLGWWTDKNGRRLLLPGDKLTLCPKVMGRQGAPLERIVEVDVTDVYRQRLWDMPEGDVAREAVPDLPGRFDAHWVGDGLPTAGAWVAWFCEEMGVAPDCVVTVIEWLYPTEGGEG